MDNKFTSIDATWYSRNVTALGQIPANPYKTSDRYQKKVLISDSNGQHIQFIQKRWFPTTSSEDTMIYVDAKYAYRPDIISVDYYNTPLYAWAILAANDIRSVWQLVPGTRLKLPDIAEIVGGLN